MGALLDYCAQEFFPFPVVAPGTLRSGLLAMSMAGDEILKNTFANNAFEHFEIAAYKSWLTLCGPAGADSSRLLLETSLKEEEAMAAWVDQNVAKVTMDYVNKEQRAAA
jgi:ferritin-like metal-binding protein YciE